MLFYFLLLNSFIVVTFCKNLPSKLKTTSIGNTTIFEDQWELSTQSTNFSISTEDDGEIRSVEDSLTNYTEYNDLVKSKDISSKILEYNDTNNNPLNTTTATTATTASATPTTTEFIIDRIVIDISQIEFPKFNETKAQCCPDHEKYVVSLRRASPLASDLFVHVCIAVLITRDIVMCSAHCFYDKRGRFIEDPDYYRAVVGKKMLSPFVPGIRIREIVHHPEFLPYIRKNDIGLLRLEYQMPSTMQPMLEHISIKDLTTKDDCSQLFLSSAVLGNDALQEGYKISIQKVKIMHWMVCMKLYEKWGILVSRSQICATREDDCSTDDGSILICNNELAGILSFRNSERGFKFYSDVLPDVFTATSKYQYFLRSQINQMNKAYGGKFIKIGNVIRVLVLSIVSSLIAKAISIYIHF